MSMFRTTNPLLNEKAFQPPAVWGNFKNPAEKIARTTMTLQGAVNASFILLAICAAAAVATWVILPTLGGSSMMVAFFGSMALSLVLVLVASFKPATSPYIGPVVAVAEGVFAGVASILWSAYAQKSTGMVGSLGVGLVIQSLLLTVGIAGGLLLAYSTRLIKATENFKLGVIAATAGLCFLSLGTLLLSFFGVRIPYIWDNGPIGIGVAAVIVVIAALNLVLDFDFIEEGSNRNLPKHMEWFAAIGLLVTLVWLYVSILRLLAKIQSRD